MQASTFRLEAPDGVSILVHRWLPDTPPKAVVQIAHGLAEHGAICAERCGGQPDAYVAADYIISYHETKANQVWEGAFNDWSHLKKAASRFWRDKNPRR